MARGQLPAASHRSKGMRLFPRAIARSTEDGAVLLIATQPNLVCKFLKSHTKIVPT
jgi:hypothetical protein